MTSTSMKLIFMGVLISHLLALSFFAFIYITHSSNSDLSNYEYSAFKTRLKFDYPQLAFKVLLKLQSLEEESNSLRIKLNVTKKKEFYGFTADDYYCQKHLGKFVEDPNFIFNERNFMLDYNLKSLVRSKVASVIGNDVHRNAGWHMPTARKKEFKTDLSPSLNIFFLNGGMHGSRILGRQFGCLTQIYNRILGRDAINRKDNIAQSIIQYAKQFEKRPHCFSYKKFFPRSWILSDYSQCNDFFENHFKGPEYEKLRNERTIVYIRKIGSGSHQAKGVQPVDSMEEKALRKKYKNGQLCGKVKSSTILQTYVYNPLLLNEHKFDFRVYMVIASTNPLMIYYHDGFLRVSLHLYNVSSRDKSVLLTNTALSTKIFDIARKEGHYQGLNETELRNFQMWNLERLQKYLLDKKMINSTKWLDEYLRPEFKKAMIHLSRMTGNSYEKKSQTYELFGCDFMLDSNLNLWFIECNSGPVLSGSSEEKEKFVVKMLKDQFEIVFGMLKSRSQRIINFINSLIKNNEIQKSFFGGKVNFKDLNKKKEEFEQIIQNHIEPEYEPSKDNGFFKIYDASLEGKDKYSGLVSEECL